MTVAISCLDAESFSCAKESEQSPQPPQTDQHGDSLPAGAVARLGSSRFRHDGTLSALAFSADGKKLVGFGPSELIIWNAVSGKELHRLHTQPIVNQGKGTVSASVMRKSADLSPSGTILAFAHSNVGKNKQMKIEIVVELWEVTTSKKVRAVSWPDSKSSSIAAVRFSPDGKNLVVANEKGSFCLFDVETGKVLTQFDAASGVNTECLAFSPDGKRLAIGLQRTTGDKENTLVIVDLAAEKVLREFVDTHTSKATKGKSTSPAIDHVAFSPDGKSLAWTARGQIIISDPATGKDLDRFIDKQVSRNASLTFSPDGKTLIASSTSGRVQLWDMASAEVRHTLDSGYKSQTALVAAAPDSKTVALATQGKAVQLWNAESGKEASTVFAGHDSPVARLFFSPDGKTLFSGAMGSTIYSWDTENWKFRRAFSTTKGETLFVAPDGKRLGTILQAGAQIWDATSGKELISFSAFKTQDDIVSFLDATFIGDGKKLYTVDKITSKKSQLRTWDAATGKELIKQALPSPSPLAKGGHFTADGTMFLSTFNSVVYVYDISLNQDQTFTGKNKDRISSLAVTSDRRTLAVQSNLIQGGDPRVLLIELLTGEAVIALQGPDMFVSVVAWSSDGRVMATTGSPMAQAQGLNNPRLGLDIHLWNSVTGQELVRFRSGGTNVKSLAFSPSGKYLASGMTDGTILIWDVAKVVVKRPAQKLDKEELQARWQDLAGDDAAKAHQSAAKLITAPSQTVPFLQSKLKPVPTIDSAKISQWIADLASDQSKVRTAAVNELLIIGPQSEQAMRLALKTTKSPDAQRHLERLLSKLYPPSPDRLETLRAIMVLERIGSEDAQTVLESLVKGAPEARETVEANAALERMAKQRSMK